MTFDMDCLKDLPFDLEKGLDKPPIEVARRTKEYTFHNALQLVSIVLSSVGLVIVVIG